MITLSAHAKINLSLDIVGKREDGYHNLCTIMQSIKLADEITLRRARDISVYCDLKFLPRDDRNIAWRAAKLFMDEIGSNGGVSIHIRKRIPVGGGMGGGSADAAAVLMGLNKIHGFPIPFDRLKELGLMCGADVPFCMTGGTCLAEGLGEILSPLPALPHCYILLVKPRFSQSTKKLFSRVSMKEIAYHPDTRGLVNALHNRDLNGVCVRLYNVLEHFTERHEIENYKSILRQNGAAGVLMTGSGSVVYGIFRSYEKAQTAREIFAKFPVHTHITNPVSSIF